MDSIKEIKLTVPADLVRKSCGIAIDMGGSVLKAIYRSQDDIDEVEHDKDAKSGHMTFLSTSGKNVKEAVDHLSSKAKINRDAGSGVIHTTGIGCTIFGKLMSEKLVVKLENATEFDCFVKSLTYLARHLSRAELFEPFDAAASEKPLAILRQNLAVLAATQAEGKTSALSSSLPEGSGLEGMLPGFGMVVNNSELPVVEVEQDLYPCLLVMLGSGLGHIQVNSDGTFGLIDGSSCGGLNFLGLGSLIVGCKTFDELIDLASRGDPRNVDIYSNDLLKMYQTGDGAEAGAMEGDDSIYTKAAATDGTLMYCFGKCVASQPSDFNKEDLARSLLDKFVIDIVHVTMLVAISAGLDRICFCGSFVSTAFVRSLVTAECVKRNLYRFMAKKPPVKFDFVKPGPYLGAIGALVTHYEKFVVKPDSTNF